MIEKQTEKSCNISSDLKSVTANLMTPASGQRLHIQQHMDLRNKMAV